LAPLAIAAALATGWSAHAEDMPKAAGGGDADAARISEGVTLSANTDAASLPMRFAGEPCREPARRCRDLGVAPYPPGQGILVPQ
jgi:hypothetical protein